MPERKRAFQLGRGQFAQTFSRKFPLHINDLHHNDKAVTGTTPLQPRIGAAVEHWALASAGLAGG
jgi:hypothetical protein